ncbi:hypothetical protein BKK79_19070 [Cupriavidus sp. USMAA2-4]|uniref:MarR family transcriptional regulator n=1 Tax=Cupriavidus malaysiensis TaxID=367825 RepID=A0ABM6F5K4_9BURK|nr:MULTISPECIES: hypothetical protein [Cupriavidus]AOY93672.1 hypothetical protein BKK79_19070 [Cupriavidus sp. USMAA2-4]AOZ00052.1 hypothetical protein BKK81_13010 [Cupriavidus sp. USMAHM13]AOZ06665.1 hypothetical protein BKK80_13225 [Cupriavidus malaysiensis]
MPSSALEASEPLILALTDAMTAWQGALELTLSAAGLSYVKWLLLRAIARGNFTRGAALCGPVLIDPPWSERLLRELRDDGWLSFAGSEAPRIRTDAEDRVRRVWQAVKALHSVSVAPFNAQERVALGSLLERMKGTLHDHTGRQRRLAPAQETEAAS